MPQVNDWVREALKYIESGINHLKTPESGIVERHYFRKTIERICLYLEYHEETIENARESIHDPFYQAYGLAVRVQDRNYSAEINLNYLKDAQQELYEYLGESPPVNNPNQLTLNFDGENQNRNPQ